MNISDKYGLLNATLFIDLFFSSWLQGINSKALIYRTEKYTHFYQLTLYHVKALFKL